MNSRLQYFLIPMAMWHLGWSVVVRYVNYFGGASSTLAGGPTSRPWALKSRAENMTRASHEATLEGVKMQLCPVCLASILLAVLFEPLRYFVFNEAQFLPR